MEQFKSPSTLLSSSSNSTMREDETVVSTEPPEENESLRYFMPEKCVKSMGDMAAWLKSKAYYDLIGFITGISVAVQGISNQKEMHVSEVIQNLLNVFDKLNQLIDETPPIDQPQRFGNQAFKIWFKKLKENTPRYLYESLPARNRTAITEILPYFMESFGNATRIDYGTGHELSFVMFLCCLFKVKALEEHDNVACALKLFNKYLEFVRRLQITYRMEPAGSHGVWSLDDYQFIPFIWGSAQLSYRSSIEPAQFLDEPIIEVHKDSFMFIGCIDYIKKVKTGHFAEHSNQLWSISAVQSWTKINSGLIKMYQREILAKFPVIQHVLFGSLMSFKPVKPGKSLYNARLGIPSTTTPAPPTPTPTTVPVPTPEPIPEPPKCPKRMESETPPPAEAAPEPIDSAPKTD